MRILYVSQYFPPEMGAPATRVFELSREWVRQGHKVEVLTGFPNHPTGVKRISDRGVLARREIADGVLVQRTYIYSTPNKGIFKRMISYASFMFSATASGAFRAVTRRPDVVIGTSPQLLCALAGYAVSRASGTPFVFEVRDLWPESIIAVEAMKENLVVRLLGRIAKFLYENSAAIVTVGEGYKRKICELYGISGRKIFVIPNGIDPRFFTPSPKGTAPKARFGWEGKIVVLYLGTLGMAHALHKVLEAAREMVGEKDIYFVFVGEGAEKENLMKTALDMGLRNVEFIDQQPKKVVRDLYAACDLGLVTLRDTPLFQEVLPSKIFEYLGMAKPILISVAGEARKLVENAKAGEFVPPEDVNAMVEALIRLSRAPKELKAMGRRGRDYVVDKFNRRQLAGRYLQILQYVMK